jgi:hypothetical protein
MYHTRIVLSVGGSVWYMVRNHLSTVTTESVLANSKTQNAFFFPVHAMFHHDCPVAVRPASMPWHLGGGGGGGGGEEEEEEEILYLFICSFLLCLSVVT